MRIGVIINGSMGIYEVYRVRYLCDGNLIFSIKESNTNVIVVRPYNIVGVLDNLLMVGYVDLRGCECHFFDKDEYMDDNYGREIYREEMQEQEQEEREF